MKEEQCTKQCTKVRPNNTLREEFKKPEGSEMCITQEEMKDTGSVQEVQSRELDSVRVIDCRKSDNN